jgi:hypothetical protein
MACTKPDVCGEICAGGQGLGVVSQIADALCISNEGSVLSKGYCSQRMPCGLRKGCEQEGSLGSLGGWGLWHHLVHFISLLPGTPLPQTPFRQAPL